MVELLRSPRRLLLFAFEGVLVAIVLIVAACVRLGLHDGLTYPHIAKKALLVGLVVQGAAYYAGLYELHSVQTARALFSGMLKALALASVILWGLFYAVRPLEIGRGIFLPAIAITALVVPTWRLLYNRISSNAGFLRRTLLLGNGDLAREIATLIREAPDCGLELVGLLSRDRISMTHGQEGVIGTYAELRDIVERQEIKFVIVAYPDRRGTLPVEQLLEVKFRGVEVEEGVSFYERMAGKIFVRELKPSQLIFAEGFTSRPTTRRLKRIFDVIVAGIGLAMAAPLMLLTALAIKLDSPGPILYTQTRAGEFGRLFTILKFRSMRTDAEKNGAQFAKENDDRVTLVGKFIRKTRLDELPQLWNVLRGDMSMVGPRPERPVFIEQLDQQVPFFKQRLYVKPGVTGHAQVRCKYGATADDMIEKLQYDLYYIKSYSLLFDLSIMLDTIKVVLLRIGAR
ncbi:TIGR03013 family PEP-CTERM/XrtA system glycosyltransferase [Pendulispora brunnea]|uniref:TIGR03013 family PEP-CTERM/XrtA system glycosyltransferase n=1 Tax=Pendulispora brunnea TaxID=2905690 RepID=A0ABZ2K0P4_9BACT